MPELLTVPMNLVKPNAPVTGTIFSTEVCTKGGRKSASFVRHVAIDVSGTPLAGNLFPGQSFGVIPPGVDANGKPNKVRLFSLASPSWGEDGQGNVISTTPKRVVEEWTAQKEGDDPQRHELFKGVCSNHLCDLKVGDTVKVSGPNGKRFLLPIERNAHDYIFIATGTGIAPYRSMCMELFDHPDGPTTSEVHVVMGVPYSTDLLYDDLFEGYAERFSNFHYHTVISREQQADGSKGSYVQQFLEDHFDDVFGSVLESDRGLCYMCGLIGMQFGVYTLFADRGLDSEYLVIKDEIANKSPASWTREEMRRYVRPSPRMMVEVY